MATITFDTLKFVETLERANLTREQASAIASAVRDSQDAADVATKGDLRHEVSQLERKMDVRFAEIRGELTLHRWMMGITLAGVGAIFAKLFLG